MTTKKPVKKVARKGASKLFSERGLTNIELEQAKWEAGVLQECLRQRPEAKRVQKKTEFGRYTKGDETVVKRLYTPLDIADTTYERDIGFPGQYPFTRGILPSGYRTEEELPLRFYTGYGSPENSNQRYKELIAAGANFISFALDLPTQIGYDSDNPLCEGEVGKTGLALDTLRDLEIVLDGIPLDKVKIGTTANGIGPWFLAMFLALVQKRGLGQENSFVSIQNDPLKEWNSRHTYVLPLAATIDLAADTTAYCCKHLPGWEPQYAVAAGGPGYGIATLICYIEAAMKKGAKPEEIVPRLNLHNAGGGGYDFFGSIAQCRAMRRLWAKIARERFQTDDPRVLKLRHTTFLSTDVPRQQPLNNIVRNTMNVLSCLLGNVEWFTSAAYDEALALPTFESTWLAGVTREILHLEFFVDDTVDPLAGSYFIEKLTNEQEEKVRQLYEEIEAMGGIIAATEVGFFERQASQQILKNQKAVESGERVIVGVNKYTRKEDRRPRIFNPDPEAEARQVERLHQVKRERDNARVEQCLARIRKVAEEKAAGKDTNIMPSMLDAVKAYASIGEIYGVLREVLGEYREERVYY